MSFARITKGIKIPSAPCYTAALLVISTATIRSARENKIQTFSKLGGMHHRYAVLA
jgi:hypothetical protein